MTIEEYKAEHGGDHEDTGPCVIGSCDHCGGDMWSDDTLLQGLWPPTALPSHGARRAVRIHRDCLMELVVDRLSVEDLTRLLGMVER